NRKSKCVRDAHRSLKLCASRTDLDFLLGGSPPGRQGRLARIAQRGVSRHARPGVLRASRERDGLPAASTCASAPIRRGSVAHGRVLLAGTAPTDVTRAPRLPRGDLLDPSVVDADRGRPPALSTTCPARSTPRSATACPARSTSRSLDRVLASAASRSATTRAAARLHAPATSRSPRPRIFP